MGESIIRFGTKEQKDKWLKAMARAEKIGSFALTEPDVGSDAKSIKTCYEQKDDFFILNGHKKWITFADIADFFIVLAVEKEHKKYTAFIVERNFEGVRTSPIKGLIANKAAHIAEMELKQVIVPKENVLGKVGSGFVYIVNTALDHGRYSIAWAGVAIAQEALECMVTYARNREQFGKKIYNYQHIQGKIADAITNIHAARSLCIKAGELRKNNKPEAIIETSIAKYFSSKIAMHVTIDAVQVFGGDGCYNKYPVERLFREAKILEISAGTSQIQQGIISKYGLRKYFKPNEIF